MGVCVGGGGSQGLQKVGIKTMDLFMEVQQQKAKSKNKAARWENGRPSQVPLEVSEADQKGDSCH